MATLSADGGERVVIMKTWEQATVRDCLLGEAISLVLLNHPNILEFLFDPIRAKLRKSPDELLQLSKSFSSGERILVRVALDIWNGSGNATVWQILESLDDHNLANVLNGLSFLQMQNSAN